MPARLDTPPATTTTRLRPPALLSTAIGGWWSDGPLYYSALVAKLQKPAEPLPATKSKKKQVVHPQLKVEKLTMVQQPVAGVVCHLGDEVELTFWSDGVFLLKAAGTVVTKLEVEIHQLLNEAVIPWLGQLGRHPQDSLFLHPSTLVLWSQRQPDQFEPAKSYGTVLQTAGNDRLQIIQTEGYLFLPHVPTAGVAAWNTARWLVYSGGLEQSLAQQTSLLAIVEQRLGQFRQQQTLRSSHISPASQYLTARSGDVSLLRFHGNQISSQLQLIKEATAHSLTHPLLVPVGEWSQLMSMRLEALFSSLDIVQEQVSGWQHRLTFISQQTLQTNISFVRFLLCLIVSGAGIWLAHLFGWKSQLDWNEVLLAWIVVGVALYALGSIGLQLSKYRLQSTAARAVKRQSRSADKRQTKKNA